MQQQLTQADINQDNASRMKAYQDAEQSIVNDVGWLPMFQAGEQYLINPKLHGLVMNAQLTFPPDSWGNVYMLA